MRAWLMDAYEGVDNLRLDEVPDIPKSPESVLAAREQLCQIAEAALSAGRLLMEAGASATIVHEECRRVVRGLGAQHVDLRSGYASLDITITNGSVDLTRMMEVGPLGANYRLAHAVRTLVT